MQIVEYAVAASLMATAPLAAAQQLSIATGGTGGVYYPIGGGLAEMINNHIEGASATAEAAALMRRSGAQRSSSGGGHIDNGCRSLNEKNRAGHTSSTHHAKSFDTSLKHFIAWPQSFGDSTAEVKCERRHVLPKDDLIRRRSIEKVRDRHVRRVDDLIGLQAGRKDAAVVGIAGLQIADHGIDDLLGNLGAAGAIEENRLLSVFSVCECGKLLP